jgi:hypothetical protein
VLWRKPSIIGAVTRRLRDSSNRNQTLTCILKTFATFVGRQPPETSYVFGTRTESVGIERRKKILWTMRYLHTSYSLLLNDDEHCLITVAV